MKNWLDTRDKKVANKVVNLLQDLQDHPPQGYTDTKVIDALREYVSHNNPLAVQQAQIIWEWVVSNDTANSAAAQEKLTFLKTHFADCLIAKGP